MKGAFLEELKKMSTQFICFLVPILLYLLVVAIGSRKHRNHCVTCVICINAQHLNMHCTLHDSQNEQLQLSTTTKIPLNAEIPVSVCPKCSTYQLKGAALPSCVYLLFLLPSLSRSKIFQLFIYIKL